jgi:hypothetical protein
MMAFAATSSTRNNAVMANSITNQVTCYTHLSPAEREKTAMKRGRGGHFHRKKLNFFYPVTP